LKAAIRSALSPLLYHYPPFTLAPERLYLFLHYLVQTREARGSVVEIGCNLGGTAIVAKQMLDNLKIDKPYLCIDTFDGFVSDQFTHDAALGTPSRNRHLFSGKPKKLIAKILAQHNASSIELMQGDITALPVERLPAACSVVLADVDLREPTLASLEKFWPRLSPGGVILVDDCAEGSSWQARSAYSQFCKSIGLPEHYQHGMGILQKA
jgi:hypothetical protein